MKSWERVRKDGVLTRQASPGRGGVGSGAGPSVLFTPLLKEEERHEEEEG